MDPWPIIITHYISILCLGYSERYFVIFVTVERMTWQTVAHNSFFFCAKIVASLTRPEPIVLWTIYCETRGPQPAKNRQCQCGGWRVAVRTRRWAPELHSQSNKCWTPRRRQGRPPPPLPALASLTSQSVADSQTWSENCSGAQKKCMMFHLRNQPSARYFSFNG